MPVYTYDCATCGTFEASKTLLEASLPHACPGCAHPAPRSLARPHVRTAWAGIRYIAESRNEKSAHEPITEHRIRAASPSHAEHRHGTHGHAHAKRSQRPWMVGH